MRPSDWVRPLRTFDLRKLNFLIIFLCATAAAQAKGKLGEGLTFDAMRESFERSADWDKESELRLRQCKQQAAKSKTFTAYSCSMGDAGYISGVLGSNGIVRDATVSFLAANHGTVADFRRASKYLIWATQGAKVLSAVGSISTLMASAVDAPGKLFHIDIQGVRYGVMLDPATGPSTSWRILAEPAP